MENKFFKIKLDGKSGGVSSLILKNDPEQMNWIKGLGVWGVPKRDCIWWGHLQNMDFLGLEIKNNNAVSRYVYAGLAVTVTRTLTETGLYESYKFKNIDSTDLFFERGQLAIYTTFEDRYDSALWSKTHNCNVHLWCSGENSWIHAIKQGFFSTELGLFLVAGALDCYSVERLAKETSNDRGDFLVHPALFHLHAGEEYEIAWELKAFPEGDFEKNLLRFPHLRKITAKQETVYENESFEWTVTSGEKITSAEAFCNDEKIPSVISGNTLQVSYTPEKEGEYRFRFNVNGSNAYANGFCSAPFDEVVKKRLDFIVSHQQNLDEESPLYGAYFIYDFEENTQYYSSFSPDHNAMRERLAMAMLLCKYLQTHKETAMENSLKLFEEFLLRETYDPDSGRVFSNPGKNPAEEVRLYNIPWIVTFWMEMYKIHLEERYIDYSRRSLKFYYSEGGAHFYPNGCNFPGYLNFLQETGHSDRELEELVQGHIAQMRNNDTNYPKHEVRFEQTIVTPVATMFAAAGLTEDAKLHIRMLDRFHGHQPDYRLCEVPIRHWDGFWFGKRRMLGDTFPHYWSCLSGYAYALYGLCSGDHEYFARAKKNLRNCMCLFRRSGFASCAYIYPRSVALTNEDGSIKEPARCGGFYDPWANDQDWALYFMLRCREIFAEVGLTL